jgi:single-stranded-DNA-specific exonuclease
MELLPLELDHPSPLPLPLQRWKLKARHDEAELRLQKELGIPRVLACLLAQRGLEDPQAAAAFLHPRLEDLHDPAMLPDYRAAADEILGAKERGETIYIHGDYDVDGVTSAALLTRFLGKIGCKVETKVPNRFKDGYGMNPAAIQEAAALGAKLVLTCDCGISAVEEVELAHEAGMRVVITDHHTVPDKLPRAEAVVNPHRKDSSYPYSQLSGAGLVFRLCEGIARELELPVESYRNAYLDLAVLGTVADVMPLTGENRILAKFGLERLQGSKKPGLAALIRSSGVGEKLNGRPMRAYHISFMLGPRLNAAGRIEDARLALDLLLSQDPAQAAELAGRVEELNLQRKQEQDQLVEQAIEQVRATGADRHACIVISGEGWHSGVLGIVAGKLREVFCRPVFVLSVDPETGLAKGSGRSVPQVHLADAIRAHPGLLEGGGHAAAAGMSLSAERLGEAQEALHAYAAQFLTEEDYVPCTEPDLEVEPGELDLATVEALVRLEPFGVANPEPCFVCRGVTVDEIRPTRKPEHPQLMIRPPGLAQMRAPAFSLGAHLLGRKPGFAADLMFRPELDDYGGQVKVKWLVKDIRPVEG